MGTAAPAARKSAGRREPPERLAPRGQAATGSSACRGVHWSGVSREAGRDAPDTGCERRCERRVHREGRRAGVTESRGSRRGVRDLSRRRAAAFLRVLVLGEAETVWEGGSTGRPAQSEAIRAPIASGMGSDHTLAAAFRQELRGLMPTRVASAPNATLPGRHAESPRRLGFRHPCVVGSGDESLCERRRERCMHDNFLPNVPHVSACRSPGRVARSGMHRASAKAASTLIARSALAHTRGV